MTTPASQPELFELSNGSMKVKITNLGCTITSLEVPDKNGSLADVVLGFDSIEPYQKGLAPYFGCIVGRVANRIKDGKFSLEGVEYTLPLNRPPNSLHGGNKGFDKMVWEVAQQTQGQTPSITFKYHSRDGEEGYPGDLAVTATYSLISNTTLKLEMEAVPDKKATPVSLAQHTYWNLAGHSHGTILDHSIQIWGSHVTPVDQNTLPTGEILSVKGTPFDFTAEMKLAAKLRDPSSGRAMALWTNAPGMQFYTANNVNGIAGKGGANYGKHSAVCLETQGFPNAVNQPNFPSVIVQPGQKYQHTMVFEFSAE
ncbi:unnamed protein product [Linum tenue]|uniref:Aldose 1-epimerase n=1 Tax=Linum tenue TaxID=586396 RepID=A0AAV0JIB8_9ROSI|nr:unnamed protein product [Linum tenue]